MDEKEIIAEFKTARCRCQLEFHKNLIFGLLQKGATVREIAHILSEKKHLKVDQSTVSRFIARQKQLDQEQAKTRPRREKPHSGAAPMAVPTAPTRPPTAKPALRNDEGWRNAEALKQKPVNQEPTDKVFDYDPNKPLTLLPKNEKI